MHRAQAHGAGAKEHHGLPSFGRAVESEHEMREAVSSYTARPPRECGEKGWRRRGLSCLQTNKHKPAEPHYFLGRTAQVSVAMADTKKESPRPCTLSRAFGSPDRSPRR